MSQKIVVIYILIGVLLYSLFQRYGIEFVAPTVGIAIGWLFQIRHKEKQNDIKT